MYALNVQKDIMLHAIENIYNSCHYVIHTQNICINYECSTPTIEHVHGDCGIFRRRDGTCVVATVRLIHASHG